MKRKNRYISIGLIVIICIIAIGFISYTSKQKKIYKNGAYRINEYLSNPINNEYYNSYFTQYGGYPKNLSEMISAYKESGAPEEFIHYVFGDPFSCDSSYLCYIPLYNKKKTIVEGYILLSSGIDGKINNHFKDTLCVDENIPLKLYNESDTCFRMIKRWFGQCDILIHKVNGRKMLKESAIYNSTHPDKAEKYIIETYSEFFDNLSSIEKIELLEKLAKSLKRDNKVKEKNFF